MTLEVYTFEDERGNADTFNTTDAREAREYAQTNSRRWIANLYEFADSELVEDFTPTADGEGGSR